MNQTDEVDDVICTIYYIINNSNICKYVIQCIKINGSNGIPINFKIMRKYVNLIYFPKFVKFNKI